MGARIVVTPGSCFLGALTICLLPVRWWTGAALAAAAHELSHMATLKLAGGKITRICIGALGARIETGPLNPGTEILCAAAGPAGSFLLASAGAFFPEAAVCAFTQGLYNLLPIYPLDGGRILKSAVSAPVYAGVEMSALVAVLGLGLWCSVNGNLGALALLPGIGAAIRFLPRKFPCKEQKTAVQ